MFCFDNLFQGKLSPSQAGAFLFGLKIKKETPIELFSAVKVALSNARKINVNVDREKIIDTCGTGGDGKKSFNCSTAVALFLADMGYKVVKHGNRAISSFCGSADIIDALNIPIFTEEKDIYSYFLKTNLVFLLAPYFHPAFSNIAPIRKELEIPTIFNLMGPLLNPAMPDYQLIGVGDEKYMKTIAKTLQMRGIKKGAIVHGDGFDEITPTSETKVILISENKLEEFILIPEDFGINRASSSDIVCFDKEDAIKKMEMALEGNAPQVIKDMIALNLGMAIFLLEEDKMGLKDCINLAKKRVTCGINRRRFQC